MIQGKKRIETYIEAEEVIKFTNEGYDIYKYYLGNLKRIMNRPWGKKETKLSWGIFYYNRNWMWKDYASEETGNCILFVQKLFGLTYNEALHKISWDFGIGGSKKNNNPVIVTWDKPDKQEFSQINIIEKPFTKKHHDFWNIMEVSEQDCKSMNCFAVKSAAYNRSRIGIKPNEVVFAYYAADEFAFKLYFPEREINKFKNTVSGHYLWNYNSMNKCDKLLIQKSNKDLIVTHQITPCVIATQNESAGIFDEEMVNKISDITNDPWIFYGSDPDGVVKCQRITKTNKWKYINIPKKYLPDVNDSAAFVKMHNEIKMGTGLKALEEFMKLKQFL